MRPAEPAWDGRLGEVDMELRMKSATLALVALTTSSLACIERAAPCDSGTFDGESLVILPWRVRG